MPICPNCGEEGPHFVTPSLGEPGYFECRLKAKEEVMCCFRTVEEYDEALAETDKKIAEEDRMYQAARQFNQARSVLSVAENMLEED